MEKVIDFLTSCSECYYNLGKYYNVNEEEGQIIENELNTSIFTHYPQEVTDEIYDKIYDLAKNLWSWNDFFNLVGASVGNYGDEIEFKNPAGSMTELKEGDWDKWKIPNSNYVISEKLDGLSVILFYKDGQLVKAASRGDGYKGKDITRHILYITNIPKTISQRGEVEIRGELICPKKDIPNMISELKTETGRDYKNGRNTIAGFLNSKKTLQSVAKFAEFNAFDIQDNNTYMSESDRFVVLGKLNFDTPNWQVIDSSITEEYLMKIVQNVKEFSKYECDGIILTIDKPDERYDGFETGTINPKKSRKFKLGAVNNSAETTVRDITWQVSKSGSLIPVLEIEPVDVVGVTIKRATGHNYKNIIDNSIGVGSKIIITRSGDVIPYVKKVLTKSTDYNLPNIETYVDGVHLKLKDISTPSVYVYEMYLQQLVFFCKTLGIDFIGAGNLECLMKWFDNKYNRYLTPIDLLQLSKTILYNEIGANGEKIYESLKTAKENASEVDFMVALAAFGEGFGKAILKTVFDKFHTLDVNETQLKMITGFGDIRRTSYLAYIDNYRSLKTQLERIGIKFLDMKAMLKSNKFADYVVCFTGCRDAELSKFIRENGGIATDSWNKNVNLLVTKDIHSTSGKVKKAQEKGIKIISLDEAKEMFK